jgi:hypothetical protein
MNQLNDLLSNNIPRQKRSILVTITSSRGRGVSFYASLDSTNDWVKLNDCSSTDIYRRIREKLAAPNDRRDVWRCRIALVCAQFPYAFGHYWPKGEFHSSLTFFRNPPRNDQCRVKIYDINCQNIVQCQHFSQNHQKTDLWTSKFLAES